MSLKKGAENSDGSTSLPSTGQGTDLVVAVFQSAVIRNLSYNGPVFFIPASKMKNPFPNIFILPRNGLVPPSDAGFISANKNLPEEQHVYKGHKTGNFGHNGHLIRRY